MAELELVGAEAECAAEQLIAEADAEERVAGVQDLAQQLDLGVGLLRVAGAVGEEHTVRVQRGEFLEVIVDGTTCTRQPRSAMRCGVMPLTPRSTAATV